MEIPLWALAFTYWLHLIATVVWLGGLAVLALLIWPALPAEATTWLDALETRFRPYVNGSLATLLITGFVQMGSDPNYSGLFVFDGIWAWAMLIKHVLFGGMVVLSVVVQMRTLPELDRAHLLGDEAAALRERAQLRSLTRINLGLGVLVLLMTAIMTAV